MARQPVGLDLSVPKGVILKDIPGVINIYQAGSDGNIYSFSTANTNAKKPKPFRLSKCRSKNKYFCITVCKGKHRGSRSTHELICLAFHGNKPFRRACVRHLDGDWSNNTPENLKWGTYSENEADKRRHGKTAMGERHGSSKLTPCAVKIIRASIPYGLWDSVNAAKVFGVSPSTINQIVRGKTWKSVK